MATTTQKEQLLRHQADPGNRLEDYSRLTEEQKKVLGRWIERNFEVSRQAPKRTSYGYKHDFESDKEFGGFYISNGQFKAAMLAGGYQAHPEDVRADVNWRFYAKFITEELRQWRRSHGRPEKY